MCPMVNTDDLCDAHEVAGLLGLSHPNSVFGYLRRYDDMPRPVVTAGPAGSRSGCGPRWGLARPAAARRSAASPMTRRRAEPARSNDPCWCGSGRKLKRCHGAFESRRPPVAGRARRRARPGRSPTHRAPAVHRHRRPRRPGGRVPDLRRRFAAGDAPRRSGRGRGAAGRRCGGPARGDDGRARRRCS